MMKLNDFLIATMLFLMLIVTSPNEIRGQSKGERIQGAKYEETIARAAAIYDVDPYLLWTVAYLESRFNPLAVSYKDGRPCAHGIMQFTRATAARYNLRDPYQPGAAIEAGARYLKALTSRFGETRPDLILAAYNSGEGTVEAYRDGKKLVLSTGKIINENRLKTAGIPPYKETRDYVQTGRAVYRQITSDRIFSNRPLLFNTEKIVVEENEESSDQMLERSVYIVD